MRSAEQLIEASGGHLSLTSPAHLPELRLLHIKQFSETAEIWCAWSYVWQGGAALSRWVIDNPLSVRGKRVVDLGAGSGVCGIAAAVAGAASVLCVERDELAREVIDLNARENGVGDVVSVDKFFQTAPLPDYDVLLLGDVFHGVPGDVGLLHLIGEHKRRGGESYIGTHLGIYDFDSIFETLVDDRMASPVGGHAIDDPPPVWVYRA